jgi:hypothetical protein
MKLCKELQEIMTIFSNVAVLSPHYLNATYFTIKRLYNMMDNRTDYNCAGTGRNVKYWKKREMPSDPDIAGSFFAAILDKGQSM